MGEPDRQVSSLGIFGDLDFTDGSAR